MRALLDTGTTSTIILREFVGKVRARTNTKKRTKWKTLGGAFRTNNESLLDFKFPGDKHEQSSDIASQCR
jgi:hypothetical protein